MSQQINLFNPVFLKQSKLFSAVAMAQGLALIGLGMIALSGYSYFRIADTRAAAAAADVKLKRAQDQLAAIAAKVKPTQKDKAVEDEIRRTESRLRANQQILDFVQKGDFGNSHGFTEYFRAFSRRATAGVWLTGFSLEDGGNDIEIKGRALQPALVPAYVSSLRQESVFKGKSFGSMVLRVAQVDVNSDKVAKSVASQPADPQYVEFAVRTSDAIPGQDDAHGDKSK